ncbi:PREDICTED: WAP four-disulfide core domain protein 2-like isoform X1 [Crocodylus porosus]|uniref:WAP four-disulfide core domain protein 2-like isoform X1 n=1 Tax=Crocodylus porosus TaxID=8502 RepID=UPI00093992E6|nr:PREDICTED: WAP four-disulfide core domain protein 2-like isoform X1 [Crocodylus porosus]
MMLAGTLVLVGLLMLGDALPLAPGAGLIPRRESKAGVCPDEAKEAANCTEGCQDDSNCNGSLKCCLTACGMACQTPNAKPGNCPEIKPGIPMLGLCRNQCSMDSHCISNMKCCANGCGKVSCMTPVF